MLQLHPSTILVRENRQRREFDDQLLMELTDSIRSNGLLHAPVVRKEGEKYFLVAGERRLRASQTLFDLGEEFRYDGHTFSDTIPCQLLGELSEIEAEEAELEENIRRVDLSWQERADATLRLKSLRERQAVTSGAPKPTLIDIAKEVSSPAREGFAAPVERGSAAVQQVSKELLVARNLHDPDVAKAKTLNDAFKILRQKERHRQNEDLAAIVGTTFTSAVHQAYNTDCLAWMQAQPAAQFDVILTDPPYGMGAQDFGDAGGKLLTQTHQYDDSYEAWKTLVRVFVAESYRLAKPEAHLYVFCDIERFIELRDALAFTGWRMFRTPIVVYKTDGNRLPWPEHGPQRKYELCAFGIKGDRRVNAVRGDVIPCTGDENFGHGAQKPVALYKDLLSRSVRPGNKVADFFCGTGPIFPAAHELKCIAVGVEQAAGPFGVAVRRIQELK